MPEAHDFMWQIPQGSLIKIRKNLIKHLCLLVISLCIGCSPQHDANKDLRDRLRNRKIMSITVFQIPEDIETPVAITSQSIEKKYHAKLELRAMTLLQESEALDRALANTDCKPSDGTVDVRTAIVFFDETDTKVKGFYYGRDGKDGQVDSFSCKLGSGLRSWVRKRLR